MGYTLIKFMFLLWNFNSALEISAIDIKKNSLEII